MPVAADYPFLEVVGTMLVFFAWIIWFWLIIKVAIDVFRRHDVGGGKKCLWIIFIIFIPFIGVFAYLIVNGSHMAERDVQEVKRSQSQFDDYVRTVAGSSSGGGGATAEIARAKELLDSGAITQAEFDAIKAKALA
jgi:hypothetical protein